MNIPNGFMMKDQNKTGIYIFVALDCEAKPLINYYSLKRISGFHSYTIYSNEKMFLTVTGIGKIAMASGVAYTLALFKNASNPLLVNIGIAGHKAEVLGSLVLAVKLIDDETGKRFYPQLLACEGVKMSNLKTVSSPVTSYKADCLYDMEASAFYETATRFSTGELIQCLKIVSDNEQSSIENIKPTLVARWIDQQVNEIDRLIKYWQQLRLSISSVQQEDDLEDYVEIIQQWHFTVSGKIKLKTLLKRWHLLTDQSLFKLNAVEYRTSKEVLKNLEAEVSRLDFYL